MNIEKRKQGFWSLKDVNIDFWMFQEDHCEKRVSLHKHRDLLNWHYGEIAAFYVSDSEYTQGSSLEQLEDYCEVILWIECWEYGSIYEDPDNNPNNFKYRLRYNDGDDGYREKFFETLEKALEDFELLKLVTYQQELWDLLNHLNFKHW